MLPELRVGAERSNAGGSDARRRLAQSHWLPRAKLPPDQAAINAACKGGVKISLNPMKSSLDAEIADVSLRKLLTIASTLAFQYAENGADAYYITRRACVE